jgi:non-heme chloroperoxidase
VEPGSPERRLADDYRQVAMDLRGHGLSDKPRTGATTPDYGLGVSAVITALGLDQPVLSVWSYGPLVILDHIRYHGEDDIGGLNFVGGINKLGSDAAMSVIRPEILSLVPGFFATDAEGSVRSFERLSSMFFTREPSADDLYLMLGYNVSVRAAVGQAPFSRSFDNDNVLANIRKPVRVLHGAEDAVVQLAVVDQHKAGMPHAQISVMLNAGHAYFGDDAATFNQQLRAFCQTL